MIFISYLHLLLPLEDILDEASGLVLESPDTEDVDEHVILSVEDAVDGSVAELETDSEQKVRHNADKRSQPQSFVCTYNSSN